MSGIDFARGRREEYDRIIGLQRARTMFTRFLPKDAEEAGRRTLDFRAAFDETAPHLTDMTRQEYNAEPVPQWQKKRIKSI